MKLGAVLGTGAAVAGLIGIYLAIPPERLESLKEDWRRFTGDRGQICLDYERPKLKDPLSARVLSVQNVGDSDVEITYLAKNSYGAYGQRTALCNIHDGKVDEFGTSVLRLGRENDAERSRLVQSSSCLRKKAELLRKELPDREIDEQLGAECLKILKNQN